MVGMVRHCASLCAFWCDCARDYWTGSAWKRLRGNAGEKADREFEGFARGSRQGFDDLWLDRQKQRHCSDPDRACHGIDCCRAGEAKAGARGSNRYADSSRGYSEQAAGNRRRCCEPCSGLSGTRGFSSTGPRIAFRASSRFAFASGSVVTTGLGLTKPHDKSMTILNISIFQRLRAQ